MANLKKYTKKRTGKVSYMKIASTNDNILIEGTNSAAVVDP